jgi:predicted GNAT family acetyltransferase
MGNHTATGVRCVTIEHALRGARTESRIMTNDQDSGAQRGITHRTDERRFVLTEQGADLAHLEYVVRDGVWFITHTYTEPAARGRGLAAQVTRAALDAARVEQVRVRPVCPFVVDYVSAHPEYSDLLVSARQQ